MKYRRVDIPVPAIVYDERLSAKEVDKGIYVCGDDTIVMKARLKIEVENQGDFLFDLWISVDLSEFTRMMKNKKVSDPFTAKVISDLPLYGEGKGQIVEAFFDVQSSEHRVPFVNFLDRTTQIYKDQIGGIGEEVYSVWIQKIDSGDVLTSYKKT